MDQHYVPALRFGWATRFYDVIINIFMRAKRLRDLSVATLEISNPSVILEAGCGTGSLTIPLAEKYRSANIVAVDIDAQILAVARSKAIKSNNIIFRQASVTDRDGMANAVAAPVDAAISSLVFHHLTTDGKRAALENIAAALEDGGELHIIDWGPPKGIVASLGFWFVRLLDGMAVT